MTRLLNAVIRVSLENRLVVAAVWAAVSLLGVISASRLPMDAFPDTTPVQVQVNTTAAALSPLEVERQLTFPVEQALSGLPGLEEVRSLSKFGFSQVTLVFEDGADLWRARQTVAERLSAVELAAGVDRPQLGPVATGLGEVFHYLVTGEGKSLAELRTVQDWIIKPQLRALPGVAEVNTWGGDERRIEVVVDPTNLQKYGLSLDELVHALEENNGNVGGGSFDASGEATLVQGLGTLTSLAAIEQVVVTSFDGVPVRVRDVATVVEGREIRRGAVTANGQGEAVLGLGFMLMGENSHDVTTRLALRLDEVRSGLPDGVQVETVYARTTLVDQVLATVERNLLEGALLVVVVIFLFLGNWRAGLIVAVTIPISMLFATNWMLQWGIAGSLMSLGAIDFGLLVDSSIIQVENAVRRLGENPGKPKLDVVREAAVEVLGPTMFGQFVIIVVYLPILTLQGIEGRLFRPMALTVVFALVGATLASITLVPVLSSYFLRQTSGNHENALVRGLQRMYRPVVRQALASPGLVLGIAGFFLLNAGFLATRLGTEFIPRLGEGTIVINTVRLASVSLDESVRYGTQIERVLLQKFPDEVARLWTRTGTAEVATDPMGTELSDVFVSLKPRPEWTRAETQDELVKAMQAELSVLPGMRMVFTQPIEMRVNEMVAGIRADVGIKLFGDDLEVLKTQARAIEAVVNAISGAADVSVEQVTGVPVLQVAVNPVATGRYGIPTREVLDVVEALGGREVGEMQEGERRFPIAVRIDPRYQEPALLKRLLVTTQHGERLPLASLATLTTVDGPSTIQREWAKRRIVVQTNVRGRDVGGFVRDVERAIHEQLDFPDGYFVRYGGQFENLQRAQERLAIVVPVALGLIFALLYATYGRMIDAARVFTGVPFAAVGGIVALWARDLPFSVSAAVGFVALSGVSVLGDMVLVSTIRRNLDAGLPLREAVETAATERLRPVLMTALVASFGFVPMALNTGIGAEVQRPLATVVVGGLFSSTALTLVVLPVLYTVLRKRA